MGQRLDLHSLLVSILGSEAVYFQPPENLKIEYPCIIYRRNRVETSFADNHPYSTTKRYQVMVIDRNPDSDIPDKISQLPLTIFDRHYVAENLNHDVYNLYF